MSENVKIKRITKLRRIHWGRKSPISQPKTKEVIIVLSEDFDLLANGLKTLNVNNMDSEVQIKKINVAMWPNKKSRVFTLFYPP